MARPHNPNKRISYKSGDEKIWDAAGIPVPHEYVRRPKTLARIRRIRRIAAILFAEGGLAGISMHDIGRAAKVAPTSIAYYYSNRERLLADVLVHHMDALLKVVNVTHALHHDKANPEAWLADLTLELLRTVTSWERAGHRVLVHTLHTLPQIEHDDIAHRVRNLRLAFTQPMALIGNLEWTDPRLDPLGEAYLAMISHAAIWFPAREVPDARDPALEAHARLLTRMALEGIRAVRMANELTDPCQPDPAGGTRDAALT